MQSLTTEVEFCASQCRIGLLAGIFLTLTLLSQILRNITHSRSTNSIWRFCAQRFKAPATTCKSVCPKNEIQIKVAYNKAAYPTKTTCGTRSNYNQRNVPLMSVVGMQDDKLFVASAQCGTIQYEEHKDTNV